MNDFCANMAKESVKTTTPPMYPPKTTAVVQQQSRPCFYRPTFFKLASDMSGEELMQLEYIKAHRNAYGERMTKAQERRLERRLTELCQLY